MKCETCRGSIDGEPGFSNAEHDFCSGVCADEARAVLAEDIAREAAHVRGERCVVEGCWICSPEHAGVVNHRSTGGGPWMAVRS